MLTRLSVARFRIDSAWVQPLAGGLGASLGALVAWGGGFSLLGVLGSVLLGTVGGLVTVSDLRERKIPNAVTYPAFLGAVALAAGAGIEVAGNALLGAAAAGGALLLFHLLSRGALGLGDVKLSAYLGAALGVQAVPALLVLSAAVGALGALVLVARGQGRGDAFAYGPYIALSGLIVLVLRGPLP